MDLLISKYFRMFAMSFEEYIEKVKSNLYCNLSEDEKKVFYSYDFTEDEIDSNLEYFKDCYNNDISAYTSLLFFADYLRK